MEMMKIFSNRYPEFKEGIKVDTLFCALRDFFRGFLLKRTSHSSSIDVFTSMMTRLITILMRTKAQAPKTKKRMLSINLRKVCAYWHRKNKTSSFIFCLHPCSMFTTNCKTLEIYNCYYKSCSLIISHRPFRNEKIHLGYWEQIHSLTQKLSELNSQLS